MGHPHAGAAGRAHAPVGLVTQRAPAGPASLVGRRDEVAGVRGLLSASRLVTLTGVGGVGKTRLARQVAEEVRRAFPDGVWFVDLAGARPAAPVAEPDARAVAGLVAAVVGVPDLADGPTPVALAALAAHVGNRRTLLVLDGCEAVPHACAELVGTLLRACPWQRILATGRQPLDVGGEVTFPVPPLPVPAPAATGAAEVAEVDAVALFAERARAVRPGFAVDDATADAVAAICGHVDGLPLAVELAATRLADLSPAQVLDALTDPSTGRVALLDAGRADDGDGRDGGGDGSDGRDGSGRAPLRHRTLRACVDWSHELCTEAERTLWARLSVFEGDFEMAAVEAVCGERPEADGDLLDLVTSLVTKSVLVRRDDGRVVRYRMPAVVREYGRDRLDASGEAATFRRRHRDRYERLARESRGDWPGPRQGECLARLARDAADLRAAVEQCLAEADGAARALAVLTAVPAPFWQLRGLQREARSRLEAALARETAASPLRARSLVLAGRLAFGLGDHPAAERSAREGRELARRLGAVPELAGATHLLGLAALAAGDLGDAVALGRRALDVLAEAAAPDPELRLTLLDGAALTAALAGDRERAAWCRDEVLAVTGRPGDLYHRSRALVACALAAWRRHDTEDAAGQAAESLRLARRLGTGEPTASWDVPTVRVGLEILAWAAGRRQRHRRAAALLAAAEALDAEAHEALAALRHLAADHDRCAHRARDALGEDAYAAAGRRGRGLRPDDAVGLALGPDHEAGEAARTGEAGEAGAPGEPGEAAETAGAGAARDRGTPAAGLELPLTPREQQVAGLVASGHSNREIAAALVISQRTAEAHVGNILTKLGLTTRAQIAVWATRRHLVR